MVFKLPVKRQTDVARERERDTSRKEKRKSRWTVKQVRTKEKILRMSKERMSKKRVKEKERRALRVLLE